MDPVSAAGMGIAVTSLALQLFSGCIEGYQMMLSVLNMPKDVEPLRIRMQLEQIRILEWGKKIGLLEDVLEAPSITLQLHRNLIFDLLLQVQNLFRACLKIEAKFATATSILDPFPHTVDSNISRTGRTKFLLGRALQVASKFLELPKRLEWALIKKDSFERLVEQLIRCNDSIVSLLDGSTIHQIYEMQTQSKLLMLQLSGQIEDLRQLTEAMQMRADGATTWPPIRRGLAETSRQNMQEADVWSQDCVVSLAKFKADRIVLEENFAPLPELMKRSDMDFPTNGSTRQLGSFKGHRIWIEWKTYDRMSQMPFWKNMIETRVRRLAALLAMKDKPAEFRSPICLGCFHDANEDDARFGLVYAFPTVNDVSDLSPVSLLSLLKFEEPPSLTRRIALASELATSIMYLHSVNWLHKGIRSDNIIFFSTRSDIVPDYTSPTISGFEYARPDLPTEMTEKPEQILEHDIYRHPNAIHRSAARSQKSWDIYGLGIILIEIAFWQSIDVIAGIDLRNKRAAMSKARKMKELLTTEDFLAGVGSRTGDIYQEVVRRCIAGGCFLGIEDEDADESDPMVGAELLRFFSDEVVAKLKSIRL